MSSKPKRRWFSFRLRTLLILVVVAGCALTPLAMKIKKAREQKEALEQKRARKKAIAWVLENSGEMEYDGASFPTVRSVYLPTRLDTAHPQPWPEPAQVGNLSPLQGLPNLQKLHIWDTEIRDISPLRGLTFLQELFLDAVQVHDLSPLQGLTDLRRLGLVVQRRTDLSPVGRMTNIREIRLAGPVSDLSPLTGLAKLERLYLHHARVTDEEVARLQKALPNCKIIR